VKEGDGLAYSSRACQGQIFDFWLAIPIVRLARLECSFELAYQMQVENISDGGIIGRVMLHFKPSTPILWNAENSQVSMTQFKKG